MQILEIQLTVEKHGGQGCQPHPSAPLPAQSKTCYNFKLYNWPFCICEFNQPQIERVVFSILCWEYEHAMFHPQLIDSFDAKPDKQGQLYLLKTIRI